MATRTVAPPAPAKLEPADWQGSAGQRWASNVDHFETMLKGIGSALLAHAALTSGERVIEIGCGGGRLTCDIAQMVAPATAVGLDIAPVLGILATARAASAGVTNVKFITGDAQTTIPEGGPFDRLISRFGVMFFSDPAAAMVNLLAMLKPGGRLDFAVWAPIEGNPWAATMMQAGRAHLGLAAPIPGTPGPFAFGDTVYLESLLTAAGFKSVAFTPWQGKVQIGEPGITVEEAAQASMTTGSLADPLAAASEAVRAAVKADLVELLSPYLTDQGLIAPAAVHLVTAFAG